jgi:AraC-like DNA-binding protein
MIDALTFLHGHHTPQCIATVDKHFTYHTVQLMTRGCVELFYDDRRYEMRGTWMWPCYPGPRIRFNEWPRGDAWEHRYVAFTGPRVAEWESEGLWFTTPEQVKSTLHARQLVKWFDEMLQTKQQPGRWAQRTAVNMLERILLDVVQRSYRTKLADRPDWLTDVMNRLAQFHGWEPNYVECAQDYGMALSTLRRRFRELTGTSLHDYRVDCRISAARQLLGDTAVPIKAIARQLGYSDVFYFSRQFRQRAGVSPAGYRKSRQVSRAPE